MEIQHIRNATVKLKYAGKTILIDPYFADKFTQPSFAGKSKNPTSELPISIEEILEGVDFILISHLHPDHFDSKAINVIPKKIKLYCQPEDLEKIKESGFNNAEAISKSITIEDIEIIRTSGQHGTGRILNLMGAVSGFVFKSDKENTVYWTGDTVLCEEVKGNITSHNPSIIICHAGGNQFINDYNFFGDHFKEDSGTLVMDKQQILELCKTTTSKIIATHIGALDHETISRSELASFVKENEIGGHKLFIPENGEVLKF